MRAFREGVRHVALGGRTRVDDPRSVGVGSRTVARLAEEASKRRVDLLAHQAPDGVAEVEDETPVLPFSTGLEPGGERRVGGKGMKHGPFRATLLGCGVHDSGAAEEVDALPVVHRGRLAM